MTRQQMIERLEKITRETRAIANKVPDEQLECEFLQVAGEAQQAIEAAARKAAHCRTAHFIRAAAENRKLT